MKILIAGYGYLGAALGKSLVSKGNEVWGLSRTAGTIRADLTKPETLLKLPQVDHAVLCQAPSKPDNYYDTYVVGTRHLIRALVGKLSGKLILISSTRVYGRSQGEGGAWIDESVEPEPDDEDGRSLLEAERIAREASGVIFRLGGIYGPERNRIRLIRSGELIPKFSETTMNRIHVDDAVRGIELLIEKGRTGEIYLGVDDRPSTQKEFYVWLLDRLGVQPKVDSSQASLNPHRAPHKRCSNQKIKMLGFSFIYPSYIEGYSNIIL